MSDRLAVSAAFSVLMMSAFILLGPAATPVEFTPQALRGQASLFAPAGISATGISILSANY